MIGRNIRVLICLGPVYKDVGEIIFRACYVYKEARVVSHQCSPTNAFITSLRRCLPHSLYVLLDQLSLVTSVRYLTREACLRNLLHESQTADRALPVADIFCLDLNQSHSRIVSGTIMYAITQVSEPCRCTFRI